MRVAFDPQVASFVADAEIGSYFCQIGFGHVGRCGHLRALAFFFPATYWSIFFVSGLTCCLACPMFFRAFTAVLCVTCATTGVFFCQVCAEGSFRFISFEDGWCGCLSGLQR